MLRKLAGVEDLIHVHLKSPSTEEPDVSHTLVYVARQWLVIPGLHGKPRRVYRLNQAEALGYQRKVFAAMKANEWQEWVGFSGWYKEWRNGVSAPA